MRLSPLDIKKQEFKRVMRGVDPEEVQAFLNMVADQWQEVAEERGRLEHKITELETKLQHYKEVEEALQEAVKTARESSRQTLEAAKQKAQSIVDAAAETAERIHHKAHADQYELKRDIRSLHSQRMEIIARLRNVLRTELELLADFDQQFPVSKEPEVETPENEIADMVQFPVPAGDQQEIEAVEDIAELEAASSPAPSELDDEDHEDALVFTAEPVVEEPAPSEDAAPVSGGTSERRDSQRDSSEMDKIRKILDDLA